MACVSEDLKCWGAWSDTVSSTKPSEVLRSSRHCLHHKTKDVTSSRLEERGVEKKAAVYDLPWKEETGPLSQCQSGQHGDSFKSNTLESRHGSTYVPAFSFSATFSETDVKQRDETTRLSLGVLGTNLEWSEGSWTALWATHHCHYCRTLPPPSPAPNVATPRALDLRLCSFTCSSPRPRLPPQSPRPRLVYQALDMCNLLFEQARHLARGVFNTQFISIMRKNLLFNVTFDCDLGKKHLVFCFVFSYNEYYTFCVVWCVCFCLFLYHHPPPPPPPPPPLEEARGYVFVPVLWLQTSPLHPLLLPLPCTGVTPSMSALAKRTNQMVKTNFKKVKLFFFFNCDCVVVCASRKEKKNGGWVEEVREAKYHPYQHMNYTQFCSARDRDLKCFCSFTVVFFYVARVGHYADLIFFGRFKFCAWYWYLLL